MQNKTNDGSRINCARCDKTFNTNNGLRGHLMQTHKVDAPTATTEASQQIEIANQPLFPELKKNGRLE